MYKFVFVVLTIITLFSLVGLFFLSYLNKDTAAFKDLALATVSGLLGFIANDVIQQNPNK